MTTPTYLDKGAQLSADGLYRYGLWRRWGPLHKPWAMFIGLNPSTADANDDDPTIRRCVGFARDWGYEGLLMANLFAFRATEPADMKAAADPVGYDNDVLLQHYARMAGVVVAAWGTNGMHLNRDAAVRKLVPDLHYLRLTKHGFPEHPLYLPAELKPKLWSEA